MSDHLSPAIPSSSRWHADPRLSRTTSDLTGIPTVVYLLKPLRVLSSAETAEYHGIVCPHNHVSVSVDPSLDRRPTDLEMTLVRRHFDMEDAEEDNHQPGRTRNLFLPLHLPRGTTEVCDCKADEEQVTEADGFTWSRKVAR